MIRIVRDTQINLDILASALARKSLSRAEDEWYSGEQKHFRFESKVYAHQEVRDQLSRLFYGKCAFCESPVEVGSEASIGHFRPTSGTVDLEGKYFPALYWWLAYDWENLYPICPECQRLRGTRFPIKGERGRPTASVAELNSLEIPLLLNPCFDEPEGHLIYDEHGWVASETEQGRYTIEMFGLNREQLISSRIAAYRRLISEWGAYKTRQQDAQPTKTDFSIEAMMAPENSYAGMRRQFLTRWIQESYDDLYQTAHDSQREYLDKEVKTRTKVTHDKVEGAVKDFQSYQNDNFGKINLEDLESSKSGYFIGGSRMVERIEIHNFKIIEDLSLRLTNSTKDLAPWLMLLGENGTGKSSVLQAMTLALMGRKYREKLNIQPEHYLRYGETEGWIRVFLTGSATPIEVIFRQGQPFFESNPEEPKTLLLSYGATRLLPRPGSASIISMEYARVDNLFNPFVPLTDANEWLMNLSDDEFRLVETALKELLFLGDGSRLIRNEAETKVMVEAFGVKVPLYTLSDGYQSVIALSADVMAVMRTLWPSMSLAEGIVIIDELGAHLHPRWKMRIVKSLRQAFPRVQFIVSTHDPLCLRGLFQDEVAVMMLSPEKKVIVLTDLPSVSGLRVDQLLTSQYFGMSSTIDPDLENKFNEYYNLLALRSRTPDENAQLNTLKTELAGLEQLGKTRREHLMLEFIDEYLAKERLAHGEEKLTLKEETRKKVAEIWKRIGEAEN